MVLCLIIHLLLPFYWNGKNYSMNIKNCGKIDCVCFSCFLFLLGGQKFWTCQEVDLLMWWKVFFFYFWTYVRVKNDSFNLTLKRIEISNFMPTYSFPKLESPSKTALINQTRLIFPHTLFPQNYFTQWIILLKVLK